MNPKQVGKSPIRCSAAELVASRFRQIHLDFHTSEHIPDVGAAFDPGTFADTLAEARVNWITLFAKCHHGLSYYPTRAGTMHPALKFDLLGEQIEACRKRGIVTPAYLSVRVDEHNAHVRPERIGRLKDGKLWRRAEPLEAGWHNLCMNHPGYVDELAAQAEEVLKWYDVEGLFFDMCYNPDPGCYCPRCFDSMKKLGLDFASDEDHRQFEFMLTRDYTKRLTKVVRGIRKNATLFFNGRMRPDLRQELDVFSHVEIEALPTGGWGYAFFPIHVRYGRMMNKPVQGMTARFHKSWADFGGLKTRDQLMYEAGTILAANAVLNVGDQCHPRGILDQGAYEVIGASFKHVEACEPWCVRARPATEIGVMMLPDTPAAGAAALPAGCIGGLKSSADGAGRMLLELKQQFDLIYPDTRLDAYKVVILPDQGQVSLAGARALAAFVKQGGAVIASHQASLRDGRFTCPGLPVSYSGVNPFKPCYLEYGSIMGQGLPDSKFVLYGDSSLVKPSAGATAFGKLYSSYFNRTYDHFCSHNQTPYDKPMKNPVAVLKGRMAYIAPAIFSNYREHAYPVYKTLVARLLEHLLPAPLVRTRAPSAMEISVNRQTSPKRLVVHLINFQPQRRHTKVEWIEDIYPVRDIALAVRTVKKPSAVYLAPDRIGLGYAMQGEYCNVVVPEVKAHAMVVLEGV